MLQTTYPICSADENDSWTSNMHFIIFAFRSSNSKVMGFRCDDWKLDWGPIIW